MTKRWNLIQRPIPILGCSYKVWQAWCPIACLYSCALATCVLSGVGRLAW